MAATGTQVFGHTVGRYEETDTPKGLLLPQKLGNILWAPMAIMGIMLVFVAFGLGIARSQLSVDLSEEFSAGTKANLATMGQLVPGFMFLGFAMIFAGISFAIARILGVFRAGGGLVQEAIGKGIKTPDMPITAWIFLVGMMMAMMVLVFTFVGHIYASTQAYDAWITATSAGVAGDQAALDRATAFAAWANPLKEVALALILTSIVFALYTISNVLGFQFSRIREIVTGQEEGAA